MVNRDLGVLILRLFIGVRLIYGVLDNVTSWEHMVEFRDFLMHNDFPVPLISAVVSVYIQLIAALMIIIGWNMKIASLLMIINFSVAIFMVHWGQSFEEITAPLAILIINVFFLLHGAGSLALERK